jgi:hypothetical protein
VKNMSEDRDLVSAGKKDGAKVKVAVKENAMRVKKAVGK